VKPSRYATFSRNRKRFVADLYVTIDISLDSLSNLQRYASIPSVFEVHRVLDVTGEQAPGASSPVLSERLLGAPFFKDYDAIGGHSPTQWPVRFDTSHWTLFVARIDGVRVGGCVVAFDTPGLTVVSGRKDVAVLWDIRVSPEVRQKGVGSALFRAAEACAAARGCRELMIETQNINVPACRFYAKQGCVLGSIDRFAYPGLPDEVQLLWFKALTRSTQLERCAAAQDT
jgi:GNAT superfamily N-acetyltransferase